MKIQYTYIFRSVGESVFRQGDPTHAALMAYLRIIVHLFPLTSTYRSILNIGTRYSSSVLGCISKVGRAHHELRSSNGFISFLLLEEFIVLLEVVVKVSLQRHVSDKSLTTEAALELDTLVNFSDGENVEPKFAVM